MYLGHRLSKDGVQLTRQRIEAIRKLPIPVNVKQLRSFQGSINFCMRFLPGIAEILHPLNNLMKKGVTWCWTDSCQASFDTLREMLMKAPVLKVYDAQLPVELMVDASENGVGAVLLQANLQGIRRPVMSLRMQRWIIRLVGYEFEVKYMKSEDNCVADMLSRLIQPATMLEKEEKIVEFGYTQIFANLPVTSEQIRVESRRDPVISKVVELTRSGWPGAIEDEDLQPFFRQRTELTLVRDCLLWGNRVIVPAKFRVRVLEELWDMWDLVR